MLRLPVLPCLLAALGAVAEAREPAPVSAEETGPAYLVYAGPYSSSPSSAFGHLFLALARRPDDPSPLWDVVTFHAVTLGAGPIRYFTVGITGGFLGRFSRVPFHEKTREYELLDDRDLWLVELRLTPAQRASLEAALADAAGRWYPYTFFQRNCAWYLQLLLARATGAVPAPSGVVSPTGVVEAVLRSGLAGPSFRRPAASRRVAALSAAAAPEVVARLRGEDWLTVAADAAWLDGLDLPGRRLAQEYFALRSLEADSALPAAAQDGLARLRVLNATAAPAAVAAPVGDDAPRATGLPIAAPAFHPYPRLRLSRSGSRDGAGRIGLEARGAMHGEADPWVGQQPLNTMELLSVELSSAEDRVAPRLESAVLFSQRALAPSDWVRRRASWLLEVRGRRGGLLDAAALHAELRGGLGSAVRLPGDVYAYALVTAAGIGAWGRGGALAPGLEAGLAVLSFDRWRAGVRWTREHDALAWRRFDERARVWARLDLGPRLGVDLALAAERPGGTTATVAVDWYP